MAGTEQQMGDQGPVAGHDIGAGAPRAPAYSAHAVHLLRTVQNNTLQLSHMADNKASILMGATFVVFSIAVSRSMTGTLPWSLAVLALFSFASSLLAVLAVMPSVRPPTRASTPNPLFFGHFAGMDEAEWTDDVLARLAADDTLFRAMLHDIYQNGKVLQQRKYRFLGHAYRCFIAGLLATLAAFLAEFARY